jgi:sugar (pentulose or hexulose) kinase
MPGQCVIGIDAGTSSIKGMLLDESGNTFAIASSEYSLETGAGDICELDPEIYWEKCCLVIRELLTKAGTNIDAVKGIAVSSQGETMIIVDSNGKPLRKAFVWLDNRSSKEAADICATFSEDTIMKITGLPEVVPTWPATKILWVRINEPEVFRKAAKYLMVEDWLMYRLTGRYVTEYSISSDTLYFDIGKKEWWPEMLSFLGIEESNLPHPLPSGRVAGTLTESAARETGLMTGTKCVTGSYDHPCGAIGAGSLAPGSITIMVGTSMAMCIPVKKQVSDPELKLNCQCHPVNDLYFILPYSSAAGMNLRWFRDEFCHEEVMKASEMKTDPYTLLDELAQPIKPGSDGLIMLPHLAGSGSPDFNANAKGSFTGISMSMKKGHFIRAIMEAVACEIEYNLDFLKRKGFSFTEIRFLGGASKSELWSGIIADITGLPVVTMKQTETASLGAAILAGTGAGIFSDIESACRVAVRTDRKFIPDPERYKEYRRIVLNYNRLNRLLDNFWQHR